MALGIVIKADPELRHVLSHMILALRALAEGHPRVAQYELQQIEGLVFFESDDDASLEAWLERRVGGHDGEEEGSQEEE